MPVTFGDRFGEIFGAFVEAWPEGALFDTGWHAGITSAQFLHAENQLLFSVIARLETIRNRIFFVAAPALIDPELRPRYFEGAGEFLTAYIRAMTTADSIYEYREIADVARRLATAETQDALEDESVQAAYKILEVDYAWFSHREGGVWNISYAMPGLIPAARDGRALDDHVDGIDRLLEGRALIYEDLAQGSPSVQHMGRMLRLGSALSVPVMKERTCIGTLGVGRRVPSVFTEHDLAIVQLLASQVASTANERRAAEQMGRMYEALQESEEKLRVLAEAIPQIVWTADPDGGIDWYNHRWYQYTGQTPQEARGWGWQAVHHPEDLPRVMEAWPRSIETGEPFEMEFRLKGREGVFRWFLTRVLPVRNERGDIIKWYGTNTDIDLHKRALRRKEEIAKTLQQVFIPKAFPIAPAVSFDAVYFPAENDAQVGGDWYDAFRLPDGNLVFSIGDVAGHGLEAAVTMGKIRQIIFTAALDDADPAEILRKVNRVLILQDDKFATALVGIVDPRKQVVRYACAGHSPPIFAPAGETAQFMESRGLALGIQAEMDLTTQTFAAAPGSLFVLYTDGLVESDRDPATGEKRLLESVARLHRNADYDTPARRIYEETLGHRAQSDDVALLVVRFLDLAAPGGVSSIQSRPWGMAWDFNSSDADAAQRARRQIVEFIRRNAHGHTDAFAIESIVGELIANTVDHAPGAVHIDIDWSDALPALTVHDSGLPFEYHDDDEQTPDIMSEGGRGLFLVRSFGATVRVQRSSGGGKDVVVVLPVTRSLPA